MIKLNSVLEYFTACAFIIIMFSAFGCNKTEPKEDAVINCTKKFLNEYSIDGLRTDGLRGKGNIIKSIEKIDTVIILKRGEIYESESKKKQRNIVNVKGLAKTSNFSNDKEKFDVTIEMDYERNDYGDWIVKGARNPSN